MMNRDVRWARILAVTSTLVLIAYLRWPSKSIETYAHRENRWTAPALSVQPGLSRALQTDLQRLLTDEGKQVITPAQEKNPTAPATHHELFSVSSADGHYFLIDFAGIEARNPNILPHPTLKDTYTIVAQRVNGTNDGDFAQLVCDAVLVDGILRCKPNTFGFPEASILPIAHTKGDAAKCEAGGPDFDYYNINNGPHDGRMFYGPKGAYVMFGSNSMRTCFGLYAQNLQSLKNDWRLMEYENTGADDVAFPTATELQRPLPWSIVEKNWFVFWDGEGGQAYLHYDVTPSRAFAKLDMQDGTVGEDLASLAAEADAQCLSRLMPTVGPELQSIHQATNSLSITMCKRSDRACRPSNDNTFIFTIFQHKDFHGFHSVYEPYVMVFRQTAPFEVYGISRKPLWIAGRDYLSSGQSEMFYVTSMSWKTRGQKYHGYLDDEVFVSFGIEDAGTAAIDVTAKSLLVGLELCADV